MTATTGNGSSQEGLAPIWVGLAIWLFFPLGLFLLWRHPTLGKNGKWWAAGIAWACFIMLMGSRAEEKEGSITRENATGPQTASEEETSRQPERAESPSLERGWFEAQHDYMRRVAEATLPTVYGDYDMKWSEKFLAGRNPSKYGWGGTAKLPGGGNLFVSFFPKGRDFVWLSSPSEGGVFAAGYSDTLYWDSSGKRIEDEEMFWKRAGLTMEEVMKDSTQMAKVHRANEEQKKQRASEKFMRNWNDSKPSR